MWEVVFPNVPVQGWVVDPDEHGFFDGSCHIVIFSAQDLKIVHGCSMATGSLMMEDWGRCLHVFFDSLSQGSPRLSHIFFITV